MGGVTVTPADETSRADDLGAAALVFGMISLLLCWWFPYGGILGACGVAMGVAGWAGGGRSAGPGTLIAAAGTGAALLLAWDYWWRVLGLTAVTGVSTP
jgi:hypothetical protein